MTITELEQKVLIQWKIFVLTNCSPCHLAQSYMKIDMIRLTYD